jgi:hypothetical protein
MHLTAALLTANQIWHRRYSDRVYILWSEDSNSYLKVPSPWTDVLGTPQTLADPIPISFWEQWNSSTLTPLIGLDFNPLSLLNEGNNLGNFELLPTAPYVEASQDQGVQETSEACISSNKNTTLCSLACQWVVQCNSKGVELDVLYLRMERGFKQGNSPLEGCRVDNQVLLSVLAEIS